MMQEYAKKLFEENALLAIQVNTLTSRREALYSMLLR